MNTQKQDTDNSATISAMNRLANRALAQKAVNAYKLQEARLNNPLCVNRATINERLTNKLKSKGWQPNAMLRTALDPTHPLFQQIGIK